MLEMFKAIKHCYHGMGTCKGCPYEKDKEKCNKLFENIEMVFTKIGEFVEFEDIRNIAQIILNKGEEKKDETKD
jgi:hypothetical protein